MTDLIINAEFIRKNEDVTNKLIEKYNISDGLRSMMDSLGDRYYLCPASTEDGFYCAFPGGLAFHNLNVFKRLKLINQSMDNDTLFLVSILHSFGKIGSEKHSYYTEKNSSWHNERGIWYEFNKNYSNKGIYMTVPHRSVWWTTLYNISLTEQQYVAIMLSEGVDVDNGKYRYNMPELSIMLNAAIQLAIKEEQKYNIVRCF